MKQSFTVNQPQEMNPKFAEAFNSGEIENLLALYEPDAVLVTRDGTGLRGTSEIKGELEKLLKLGGRMVSENQYTFQSGNVALLRAKFVLKTTDSNGEVLEIVGNTSEIVRQQPDGNWLYVVDHPFGADT